MQEIVPQLLDKVLEGANQVPPSPSAAESQPHGTKRSPDANASEPAVPAKSQRTQSPSNRDRPDESLSVECESSTFACDEVAILAVEHCPASHTHACPEKT